MIPKPDVSVIIPTYNRANVISASILSVVNQTLLNSQLIIVDDASTDHTPDVIERMRQSHPAAFITYVRQDHAGPSAARNAGLASAKAEIIVYLDSDDTFFPTALEDIVRAMRDPSVLYGFPNRRRTLRLVDDAGREVTRRSCTNPSVHAVTPEDIYRLKFKVNTNGLFHRRSLFNHGLAWNLDLCRWEELEFMLQLLSRWPTGFKHIPKILVDYVKTYGGDGICANSNSFDCAEAFAVIYDLHRQDPLMFDNSMPILDRIEHYMTLAAQQAYVRQRGDGKVPPLWHKHFPESLCSFRQGFRRVQPATSPQAQLPRAAPGLT